MPGPTRWTGAGLAHPWTAWFLICAATAAVGLVHPLTRPEAWVGWLPSTAAATELVAVLGPVVGSTAAAWVSGQPRAHGLAAWLAATPRGSDGPVRTAVLMVGSAVVVGQLLATVVLLAVSWRSGLTVGLVEPDLLFLGVPTVTAVLLLWVAAGAWLGTHGRREWVLPIAALLPYAVYIVIDSWWGSGRLAALVVGHSRGLDELRPEVVLVVLRAAFWLGAAVALLLVAMRRSRVALVAGLATGGLAAAAAILGYATTPIPGATASVCEGHRPTVCVPGAFRSVLPDHRAAVDALWPSVPVGLRPDVVVAVEDTGDEHTGDVAWWPPLAGFTSPARTVERVPFEAHVSDQLFTASCPPERPSDDTGVQQGRDRALELWLWWRQERNVPVDGTAKVGEGDFSVALPDFAGRASNAEAFAALTDDERERWFDAHAAQVRRCVAPPLTEP